MSVRTITEPIYEVVCDACEKVQAEGPGARFVHAQMIAAGGPTSLPMWTGHLCEDCLPLRVRSQFARARKAIGEAGLS